MKPFILWAALLLCTSLCEAQFPCEQICHTLCLCDPMGDDQWRVTCSDVTTAGEPFLECFNSSVVQLSILSSDITMLQGSDFSQMTNLKGFELQDSPLLNVTQDAFASTTLLEQITIRNTNLSYLFDGTFALNEALTVLNLDDNKLDLLSNWLDNATSVGRLSLSNNDISSIPTGFFPEDSSIVELNLHGNRITFINKDSLSRLSILGELDLSSNVIDGLDSLALQNLTELKTLNLHDNVITGLPSKLFKENQLLQQLNISFNQMDSTQAIAFVGNGQLQTLDASNNLIFQISSNAFNFTPGLTSIFLRDNIIDTLEDEAFNYLPVLKVLDLSENPTLTKLNPKALPSDQLFELSDLRLDSCGLTSLDLEAFVDLSSLQTVHAHDNPIFCNCSVRWISEHAVNPLPWMTPWLEGETAVLCETPVNFNGSIVAELDPQLLTCEPPVVNNNDLYSDTNGNVYYYVLMLSNGWPSTNYTLPNGKVLAKGDTYDPGNGSDIVTINEVIAPNNSIRSTLRISMPTTASNGVYLVHVSNAGGELSDSFDVIIDNKVKTDKGKIIGGIIGGILGMILVVVIFGVVVDLVKNRRDKQPYRRMTTPADAPVNTVSHDVTQDARTRDAEQSPFAENTGAMPYGGTDDVAPKQSDNTSSQANA